MGGYIMDYISEKSKLMEIQKLEVDLFDLIDKLHKEENYYRRKIYSKRIDAKKYFYSTICL